MENLEKEGLEMAWKNIIYELPQNLSMGTGIAVK